MRETCACYTFCVRDVVLFRVRVICVCR